jgi:hypothetical protein
MSGEAKVPDYIRAMAELRGLGKALKLYPDGVMAAAERGQKPLGAPPEGASPIATPAAIFNPARFDRK